MFIFEILIYVFFAYIMYYLAKRSEELYPNDEVWDYNIIWYIVFFTLVTGLRYCVGGDYFSYVAIFENGLIVEERADQEILWNWLVTLTSEYNLTSVFGFAVCGFLQILFLVKACGNNKFLLIYLPVVLFGSRYFFDMNGAIRQYTAACFFIWFSKYIYERKMIKYMICVILASLFHHSALVLSLIYFVPIKFTIAEKRNFMLLIFSICFILGITPSFSSYIGQIQLLSSFVGYGGYETAIMDYLTGERNEMLSFGPIMISFALIAIILIYYGPYLKKKYQYKIPMFNVWYNLSFFFSCAYFLVCNVGHLFIRPVQYFEYFQMIMAALLLYDLITNKADHIKYAAIIFIFIIWTSISWDIIKHSGMQYESTTYKCVLFH